MINETLKAVQQELKAPKNQKNNFGGYNYRSCEDILEAVKPILAKLNAIITLSDDLVLVGERYYVKATATLTDKEGSISVSGYAREEESKKGMDQSQITGASSSYARKYALNGLFAIDDTKDSDATNTQTKEEPKTETKKVEPKATPKPVEVETQPKFHTVEQLQEFINYGYTIDQLVQKFNKPTNDITFEELESVLIKIRERKAK